MHLAVVCSLPQTLGRESPPRMVLDLLRNTERYGFIVAGLILPPWTTSKALTWREGVWYGLAFIDAELQKHGHPKISVAYIDGAEPGGFRDSAPLDGTPEVIFAPKYGTHSYDQNLGPLGVSLLKLADMAAGQFRKQSDSRPGLDDVVKALSQSQQPRVVQLRGLNGYNGNVPV